MATNEIIHQIPTLLAKRAYCGVKAMSGGFSKKNDRTTIRDRFVDYAPSSRFREDVTCPHCLNITRDIED